MSNLKGTNPFASAGTPVASTGASPGIESMEGLETPPHPDDVRVYWCDYRETKIAWHEGTADEFFVAKRPAWVRCRWVNVDD
ncbi:MAG: hypothetical protein J6386_07650 [Candidatus Synoicihabitans palmerolidicus]|nr:hypothetical protein [Candidatus Synoicihabitans palmerolidicus]